MKFLSRVLFALAVIALIGGFILGSIPVRVQPVNSPPPAGSEKVSCGSAFSETEWSSDDACDGSQIGQRGVMFLGFALSVLCFMLGAGALVLAMRRELRYPRDLASHEGI
jgi:hypothetical protein